MSSSVKNTQSGSTATGIVLNILLQLLAKNFNPSSIIKNLPQDQRGLYQSYCWYPHGKQFDTKISIFSKRIRFCFEKYSCENGCHTCFQICICNEKSFERNTD